MVSALNDSVDETSMVALFPVKATVPELCVNVPPAVCVQPPVTDNVPLGAVNVPDDSVMLPPSCPPATTRECAAVNDKCRRRNSLRTLCIGAACYLSVPAVMLPPLLVTLPPFKRAVPVTATVDAFSAVVPPFMSRSPAMVRP